MLESQIKAIADAGADVVVGGGKFGDMALHYLNKYGLMGVRLTSKWDVRRLCKAVGATALPRMVSIYLQLCLVSALKPKLDSQSMYFIFITDCANQG